MSFSSLILPLPSFISGGWELTTLTAKEIGFMIVQTNQLHFLNEMKGNPIVLAMKTVQSTGWLRVVGMTIIVGLRILLFVNIKTTGFQGRGQNDNNTFFKKAFLFYVR